MIAGYPDPPGGDQGLDYSGVRGSSQISSSALKKVFRIVRVCLRILKNVSEASESFSECAKSFSECFRKFRECVGVWGGRKRSILGNPTVRQAS